MKQVPPGGIVREWTTEGRVDRVESRVSRQSSAPPVFLLLCF